MKRMLISLFLPASLMLTTIVAQPESIFPNVRVDVKRQDEVYHLRASFDITLSKCAAYNYLTDYEAAVQLPGVVESTAVRESDHIVKVSRTADERVLFVHLRLRSVLAYHEKPHDQLSFTQLQGDSRMFHGDWTIAANDNGSTLSFQGAWQPDTVIPLFVIDYFAKNRLTDKFIAIAQLAERRKAIASSGCVD